VVTHNICNRLYDKCDLSIFGIGYNGKIRNPFNYYVYPGITGNDIYSEVSACGLISQEKPDIVVVFNDLPVVMRYLKHIKTIPSNTLRVIPLFPINLLPLDKEQIISLTTLGVKQAMVYTEFSKETLMEINPNISYEAVYHGVDRKTFFPIAGAKEYLGLSDYFVVGNVNSNTYRKRFDLFLGGFAKFAKGKDNVRCLIHSFNKDISYDLLTIAEDLDITDKIIISSSQMTVDKMNLLYNALDVNVNTSIGEGFGLSLVEGAACGVPILCPEHGNLIDIWGNHADYIKFERSEYIAGTLYKGDVISVDDMTDKLNTLYYDKEYLQQRKNNIYAYSGDSRFDWQKISDTVYKTLLKVNSGRFSIVS
jgi:glycosyltransferase involved in cell wall biosynthesis